MRPTPTATHPDDATPTQPAPPPPPPPPPDPGRAVVCARCHGLAFSGRVRSAAAEARLPPFSFDRLVGSRVRAAASRGSPVLLLVVDVADFDGSFPHEAAALASELGPSACAVVLACTKADLLPKAAQPARLEAWARARCRAAGLGPGSLAAVRFVGAPARFGVASLAAALEAATAGRPGGGAGAGDVWVVGAQNAGKSTLVNALLSHYGAPPSAQPPVTASHVAGTTVGLVRLPGLLPGGRSLVDTPGLVHSHQLCARLAPDEARAVLPRRPLKPRTFRLPAGHCVHVGALFRIDVLEAPGPTMYLTVWASADVATHCGRTDAADGLWRRHAGGALRPPLSQAGDGGEGGGEEGGGGGDGGGDGDRAAAIACRLGGAWVARTLAVAGDRWDGSSCDVAVAGAGWVGVGCGGGAALRVWTYPGVGVTLRAPALLPDHARELETHGFDGEMAGRTRGGREVRRRA